MGIFVCLLLNNLKTSVHTYSRLRFRLKKPAHSVQVFLLPTQKTAEMPTINVIRYFIINKARSGRAPGFAYKNKIKNNILKI